MNTDRFYTSGDTITISQAISSELDIILDILEEAACWITSKGIDQWQPGDFIGTGRKKIADQIEQGEVYLASVDGQVAGTFTLQWADPAVWKDVPDDAGYVHRIAIRRAFAGKGLGQIMLEWAGSMAASQGKRYLRLDCMTENTALRQYYTHAGFDYCGDIHGKSWSASLYQKHVIRRKKRG
jgi:GNAT superfamily N-acetyltransferase